MIYKCDSNDIGSCKNYVFIGEAGSGKTQISLNFSLMLAEKGTREVHLFDMDQTKALFRARHFSSVLREKGVIVHCQDQYLDSPTVASGINECLSDPDKAVVLDVGGGKYGAQMIGQFSERLAENTEVCYVFNPYRPWSLSEKDVDDTMRYIVRSSSLIPTVAVINPNIASETTPETIISGIGQAKERISELPVKFVAVKEQFTEEVEEACALPCLPIHVFTEFDWMV